MDWISISSGYSEFSHLLKLFILDQKNEMTPPPEFFRVVRHMKMEYIRPHT
jgi:hypothetical protein